jgi:hypothetical protein
MPGVAVASRLIAVVTRSVALLPGFGFGAVCRPTARPAETAAGPVFGGLSRSLNAVWRRIHAHPKPLAASADDGTGASAVGYRAVAAWRIAPDPLLLLWLAVALGMAACSRPAGTPDEPSRRAAHSRYRVVAAGPPPAS